MSERVRKSSQIAKRYASSLLDLAEKKPGFETVENDVNSLLEVISGSDDLARAISDPRIKTHTKKAFIAEIIKRLRLHTIILNFINALAENNRLSHLKPILEAVLEEVKTRRGIIEAEIMAAQDISDEQRDLLKKSIVKSFGSNVNLTIIKDETLLGGLIVKIGSVMVDDSVKNKLARLEKQMITGHNLQTVKEVA